MRGYIAALERGDVQAATGYLGNGSPDEGFIGSDTRITSLSSSRNADGSYRVAVTMHTSQGVYSEVFIVASTPEGERILDKTAGRP